MVAFAVLGFWQVERRSWKLQLIHQVESRIHADVETAPTPRSWSEADPENYVYRHVKLSGTYLSQGDIWVHATTEEGMGYWLMTPFKTQEGFYVFINRGFVPSELRHSILQESEARKPIELTGLLRLSEPVGGWLRRNNPLAQEWYSRDVLQMASSEKMDHVMPYFIDADKEFSGHPYPMAGLTIVHFHNNHLVYAITWFTLSFLSLVFLMLDLQ